MRLHRCGGRRILCIKQNLSDQLVPRLLRIVQTQNLHDAPANLARRVSFQCCHMLFLTSRELCDIFADRTDLARHTVDLRIQC